MIKHSVVIIGGGPAGMAAAVSVYDSGVKDVVVLDREQELGGILMQCIHGGFGLHKLGEELTGPEYAMHYKEMLKERDIKVYNNTTVLSIDKEKIVTATNKYGILKIKATAIILAMGCRERSRGALNIPGTRPSGIFTAGTAQKLINCEGYSVGKRVLILGSGDIGLIMARRMTLEGAKVAAVCEVLPYSGGLTRNIVQCLEDYNIPLYLSHTVVEVHGDSRLEGVTIAKVDENRNPIDKTKRYIPCDTLLLSVGLIPENELTKNLGAEIDPITGGATVDQNRQTNIKGVFACGNVLQVHDLVDFVSDEAEIAGKAAAKYVLDDYDQENYIGSAAGDGIRYVLPQKINLSSNEDITIYFRVSRPFGRVKIKVLSGDNILSSTNKLKVAPGEMEKITIARNKITSGKAPIIVSLEEI